VFGQPLKEVKFSSSMHFSSFGVTMPINFYGAFHAPLNWMHGTIMNLFIVNHMLSHARSHLLQYVKNSHLSEKRLGWMAICHMYRKGALYIYFELTLPSVRYRHSPLITSMSIFQSPV